MTESTTRQAIYARALIDAARAQFGRSRRIHARPHRLRLVAMGTAPWYIALAAIAAGAAGVEAVVGSAASVQAHILAALFVLATATMFLLAGSWRARGDRTGPALLAGGALLVLSVIVAQLFEGSPAAVLLPLLAFAFTIPSLRERQVWAFGAVTVAVGTLAAIVSVEGTAGGSAGFGLLSSAIGGQLTSAAIVTIVLIRQRADLSGVAARYRSVIEQVPMALFRTTREGQLLDANPWFVELLGYPSESELVATPLVELMTDPVALATLLGNDGPAPVRVEEVRMRRRDGTTVAARVRIRAVHDEAGRTVWFQGAARDNTDEREASARQARLIAAIEQTAESVVITDAAANIVYVNPAFEQTTGYTRDEVIGRNPRILQSGNQPPEFYADMWESLSDGRTWKGEIVNRRKDGGLLPEQTTITPVRDVDGELSTYVAVMRDMTAERQAEADQARLAALLRERHAVADALADLGPRETPEATADAITAALASIPGIGAVVLVTFGAAAESRVMSIAGHASLHFRVGDEIPPHRVAYLRERAIGGPWCETGPFGQFEEAYGSSSPLKRVLAMGYAPVGEGSGLIGVLGFATVDPDYSRDMADHLPVLAQFANAARMLLVDSWMVERELEEARRRMSAIIADMAVQPVFQPIVDLATGAAIGFEALSRFDSGRAPDVEFAEAHRVGLGIELETATLRAQLAASERLPDGTWLSLNVSPALLLAGRCLPEILALRTRAVILEVTEHDVIEDYPVLRDAFIALGADIRLAVDDAGSGVANFNHIVELRPDFVKIDIGLIRGIDADLSRQALVVGLQHFSRASNRAVIAEGVETAAELATLRALDVRYGQGYVLGKPAPAGTWATAGATQ